MTVASDPAATPAYLPSGTEPDLSTRPQDDFYRFVNGPWTDGYVLPAHRAEATTLTLLADKVQDDVERVVHHAVAHPGRGAADRRIADLHASFMDEERIEELGVAQGFAADLAAVRDAADREALAEVMGRLQAQGIGGAWDFSVGVDTVRADQYVLTLSQAGLGLPSAGHYGRAGLVEEYTRHIAVMLAHAGLPDPAPAAGDVVALEAELADRHTVPRPGSRTPVRPWTGTVAALAARQDGFPWAAWLRGLGDVPAGATVRLRHPDFADGLGTWWRDTGLDELRLWLSWRYVHEMVPFGPRQVFADNFAFYGRTLNGFSEPRPRRLRVISFVETFLGESVADRYLAEHLAPGTVDAARTLVGALVDAYRARLERTPWMTSTTRDAALAKLAEMVFEVGRPEGARTGGDAALDVDPRDLLGNVKRGRSLHIARELARLGAPVDRSEWKIHPHQVTAYYRHGLNQVVVPAALLQPPVFDPAGDPARNFAVLGAIVGHEMAHAFDSRGSRYDGRGRLRDWWAPEDRAEFARCTRLLVDQYGGYEPEGLDGLRVDGTRTVGENMADIAGVTVAHAAFVAHTGTAGPDASRRFFAHWATMWRARTTAARMAERIASDRHPPAEFRCNGVLGHVGAFYDAFDVRPGDGLFIDPARRFTLL
ncbi:M13-type metalloendopeptidase [Streptomyces viridochromogenes]|uniref:M13-type metalloendopeptidase n=1 Tax=Streptomyces viridochromogenes TaxID=1938 RepID=UPI000A3C486B|nr:M13 family metallopeptidase [Streptomyces viridochromogenes]